MGLLSLGLLSYSCANGDTVSGSSGNGGSNSGNGGSTSTGGSNSTGTGGTHTGGTTGTGTGGIVTTGTGGTHTGGTTGAGGTHTGGTTGTGGIVTTGTGGTIVTSTGGTSGGTTCGASFAVSSAGFVTMPAKGGACWSGYAYTYDDTYGTTVVPASPTPGFSTCGDPCPLTMTGTIVAVTGTNYSFAGIGFNLGDSSAGGATHPTVTPTGNGLVISFTNTTPAALPLRAQITDGTTTWCYTVTGGSPASIPYTSFNTKCYDSPPDGTAYAKTMPINAIQLQIAGGTASGALNVTINSVTEN